MPEGDTLHRTAAGLRPYLVGRRVVAARARQPGPQIERIVGREVTDVVSMGKNLLIRFDGGLELRTHLGMHGSWHRYAPGEAWRRPAARARVVLEVAGAIGVCFDAPTVELLETRAEHLHPVLAALGPSLTEADFDATEAVRRLRDPARAATPIAEALLDQRALAGIGNVYKNETLFIDRVNPFRVVGELDEDCIARLVATARRLLAQNVYRATRVTVGAGPAAMGAGGRFWVYGRGGRACRRCGTAILSRVQGAHSRRTWWCPTCQPAGAAASETADD